MNKCCYILLEERGEGYLWDILRTALCPRWTHVNNSCPSWCHVNNSSACDRSVRSDKSSLQTKEHVFKGHDKYVNHKVSRQRKYSMHLRISWEDSSQAWWHKNKCLAFECCKRQDERRAEPKRKPFGEWNKCFIRAEMKRMVDTWSTKEEEAQNLNRVTKEEYTHGNAFCAQRKAGDVY